MKARMLTFSMVFAVIGMITGMTVVAIAQGGDPALLLAGGLGLLGGLIVGLLLSLVPKSAWEALGEFLLLAGGTLEFIGATFEVVGGCLECCSFLSLSLIGGVTFLATFAALHHALLAVATSVGVVWLLVIVLTIAGLIDKRRVDRKASVKATA